MDEAVDIKNIETEPKFDLKPCDPDTVPPSMLPSFFLECHPISDLSYLDQVIAHPPPWVERVEPLMARSGTVVRNVISDCHSEKDKFGITERIDKRFAPKTLVCHDYKGGYHSDRYLHYDNENIRGNGYTFYNWAQIDYFVYFSHHFITIPPLCWINTGHRNGVKVLGTLITESQPGIDICNKIFRNLSTMESFAIDLVKLTKTFKFDGWLLNIENKIENPEMLKAFVSYFSNILHYENPDNVVIWYDSVTEKGELLWQNQLNDKNRYFFDNCDGIFLNYTWDEACLKKSVEAARHRRFDVFVGIDVFGRNMFGGGQFNTFKAAEMVARYNLSIAIFAPGWTHEMVETREPTNFFSEFLNRDKALWLSLWPYLYTHPIKNYFSTDFYIGLDNTCYNVLSQKQQLSKFLHPEDRNVVQNIEEIPPLVNKCDCIQSTTYDNKNSCVITRRNLLKTTDYVHHLFTCDIQVKNNTVVYLIVRKPTQNLNVTILTSCKSGSFRKIKLLSHMKLQPHIDSSYMEVIPTVAEDVIDGIRNKHSHLLTDESFRLSVYLFNTAPCQVLEVGVTIEDGDYAFLSAFGIQGADGNFLKSSEGISK